MESIKETELWLPVPNFENYEFNKFGLVRNKKFGRFIFGRKNQQGYYQVTLYNDRGERKMFLIHRLVAEGFIPNPNPFVKTQIDHIDENKWNNFVGNLRFVSPKENINHGSHNKMVSESLRKAKNYTICQYDLAGHFVNEYKNIGEAARAVGGRTDSIRWALDGKSKTSYGFIWKRKKKQ